MFRCICNFYYITLYHTLVGIISISYHSVNNILFVANVIDKIGIQSLDKDLYRVAFLLKINLLAYLSFVYS